MRADNTAYVISAAKRRARAHPRQGDPGPPRARPHRRPITFEAVARAARVSRSWLYTQADIKNDIQRLRDLGAHTPQTPIPARQRSSDASLRRRLEIANSRIRELTEDNQRLRRQLAQALGHNRAGASHIALR
jgi:hypothetical protein